MSGKARPARQAGGSEPTGRAALLAWSLLAMVMAAVAAAGAWRLAGGAAKPSLPTLGALPGFTLTDSDGRPVSLKDLRGRPWVADFIFTRCTGICPLLSTRMQALQEALPPASPVRLVSISVDPQHDTPEVLAAYARNNRADTSRWLFLTGGWEETRSLVGEGFRLGVSRADPGEVEEGELVTHSDRLVLVDGKGEIRGYYHGSEDESVKRILDDLDRLEP